jgi:hypothetical protein
MYGNPCHNFMASAEAAAAASMHKVSSARVKEGWGAKWNFALGIIKLMSKSIS